MTETLYQTDYLEWPDFIESFEWQQGEHVSFIGPTGHGKTTMAGHLLQHPPVGALKPHSRHPYWRPLGQPRPEDTVEPRPFVVVFVNKRRDDVAEMFQQHGYRKIASWIDLRPCRRGEPCYDGVYMPRRLLWPPPGKMGKTSSQRRVFEHAIDRIAAEEGWTIYVDDAIYVVDQEMLRLRPEYRDSLYRLRSSGVTIVSGVQRPSGVPRELYSQVRHLFFWHTNDEADLDRIQGIGGLSGKKLRATIQQLQFHEALYINTLTERMVRTQAPAQAPT